MLCNRVYNFGSYDVTKFPSLSCWYRLGMIMCQFVWGMTVYNLLMQNMAASHKLTRINLKKKNSNIIYHLYVVAIK